VAIIVTMHQACGKTLSYGYQNICMGPYFKYHIYRELVTEANDTTRPNTTKQPKTKNYASPHTHISRFDQSLTDKSIILHSKIHVQTGKLIHSKTVFTIKLHHKHCTDRAVLPLYKT
jgi:hypothetical protein